MVVGSTRREGGAGDANKLASALRLSEDLSTKASCQIRSRRQTPISLCQGMCRSLVRPSDLDARSRAPHRSWGALALTSDRPPTHPPFFL